MGKKGLCKQTQGSASPEGQTLYLGATVCRLGCSPQTGGAQVSSRRAPVLSAGGKLAKVGLSGGGSPCAGTFEISLAESFGVKCGLHLEEASVFCRSLGCGLVLQASRPHLTEGSGSGGPKIVTCRGTESSIFNCRFNMNIHDQCNLPTDVQVVCSGKGALSVSSGKDTPHLS